ncbi:PepSY domain-containing protein [Roseococcus sp. SDR]|uniref:PepSY domain-containing protein n=1 Tax=Roseococcus sp. SDR TaxID=2835532 RepID=UPI001BCFDB7A|nr:PepSY domain-containing protein [Roseococcus sp. SDR]MBS7792668.1 PepSY domain-containing protein [Roseococcus sp. SDR]MBV1847982.1 PepSY domain-containing protein [Roseococcus sp. SDR]
MIRPPPKIALAFCALAFCVLGAGPAMADQRCNVPLADWQPRAALQQRVEAEGWRVIRIRTKDGCYRVRATNDRGQRYEGTFDPGTLRILKVEIEYD